MAAEAEEEKDEFDVILESFGAKKIQVIKVVREITSLGLKEAKTLVDGAPSPIREAVSKMESEEIKSKLEAVGATVTSSSGACPSLPSESPGATPAHSSGRSGARSTGCTAVRGPRASIRARSLCNPVPRIDVSNNDRGVVHWLIQTAPDRS